MPRVDSPLGSPRRGLDLLGRLELTALGLWYGGVFTLTTAQFVASIRDESAPGSISWGLAAGAGFVTFIVVRAAVSREWRKHGGRVLQRLGRKVWRTGQLPQQLPARIAILRDLERRERKLDRARLPVWVVALLWALPVTLNLADRPTPLHTVTWLLLWTVFLGPGIIDFIDRRTRSHLTDLIYELRNNPLPATEPASTPLISADRRPVR